MANKETRSITLIGVGVAKIGTEFVFNGPVNECETCKLKNTCLNLDVGRRVQDRSPCVECKARLRLT